MLERARDHGIPENSFVVSIVDPEHEPIFERDTDRIITLRFHDLDPQWPVDPERDPHPSYVFMNEEDAKRIVNHVLKFHEHPAPWEFLVNCMAQASPAAARSGRLFSAWPAFLVSTSSRRTRRCTRTGTFSSCSWWSYTTGSGQNGTEETMANSP